MRDGRMRKAISFVKVMDENGQQQEDSEGNTTDGGDLNYSIGLELVLGERGPVAY